jgi:hypothetical protein
MHQHAASGLPRFLCNIKTNCEMTSVCLFYADEEMIAAISQIGFPHRGNYGDFETSG